MALFFVHLKSSLFHSLFKTWSMRWCCMKSRVLTLLTASHYAPPQHQGKVVGACLSSWGHCWDPRRRWCSIYVSVRPSWKGRWPSGTSSSTPCMSSRTLWMPSPRWVPLEEKSLPHLHILIDTSKMCDILIAEHLSRGLNSVSNTFTLILRTERNFPWCSVCQTV